MHMTTVSVWNSKMDHLSKEKRSWNMSRIRSTETKPEERVRKYLFSKGFRYRKNDKRLPGKPDIVLPKYRAVIFINGCFWHCHKGCGRANIPKSNLEYWKIKLENNVRRDHEEYQKLTDLGWNVLVVWECELNKKVFPAAMEKLINNILLTERGSKF